MLPELVFSRIATAFAVSLDGAYVALHVYSLGLLAVLATMYFYVAMGQGFYGYVTVGDALSSLLWIVLKVGVFYAVLHILYDLIWNGAFYTFLNWGLAAGGNHFTYEDFLNPGRIITNGFKVAYPIKVWLDRFVGLSLPLYFVDWTLMLIAYWITVFSFGFLALHVLMALVEMKMAIATAAVLVPWGVLTQTAFLGELSLSWLAAGLVRVLITGLLMSIAVPLFELFALPVPSLLGPDPTVFQSLSMAIGALMFAVLAWVVPSRAAGIGGRGMALALGGEHFIAGGLMGVRAAQQLAGGAIRGVSRLRAYA
jgi:type IV secretion system protein TrbL